MQIPEKYKNLNKYNLTLKDIRHLIPDREKITKEPFWRNNVISAWCLSWNTAYNKYDVGYGLYDEYWLGVYDTDAKIYAGKVRFYFSSFGGMCGYKITKFLKPDEIENKHDLEIQVKFLQRINELIDNGVFKLPEGEKHEYSSTDMWSFYTGNAHILLSESAEGRF